MLTTCSCRRKNTHLKLVRRPASCGHGSTIGPLEAMLNEGRAPSQCAVRHESLAEVDSPGPHTDYSLRYSRFSDRTVTQITTLVTSVTSVPRVAVGQVIGLRQHSLPLLEALRTVVVAEVHSPQAR